MKQDEVISMAFKAGKGDDDWIILLKQLFKHFPEEFNEFVALLAAHEREACAKVCEQISNEMSNWSAAFEGVTSETKFIRKTGEIISQPFVDAIRARGNP
jgi:hypothetical protein